MNVERVELIGALFEVEFDNEQIPSCVSRISGNYQTILWRYGEVISGEVRATFEIAKAQREERKFRNQS